MPLLLTMVPCQLLLEVRLRGTFLCVLMITRKHIRNIAVRAFRRETSAHARQGNIHDARECVRIDRAPVVPDQVYLYTSRGALDFSGTDQRTRQ